MFRCRLVLWAMSGFFLCGLGSKRKRTANQRMQVSERTSGSLKEMPLRSAAVASPKTLLHVTGMTVSRKMIPDSPRVYVIGQKENMQSNFVFEFAQDF